MSKPLGPSMVTALELLAAGAAVTKDDVGERTFNDLWQRGFIVADPFPSARPWRITPKGQAALDEYYGAES